jgi:ribosomal protein S18 acetylase RimI-like enzyme
MGSLVFRSAAAGDAALVQTISAEAYRPAYLAVVGFVPKPALEDYSDRIRQGNVWVAELDGEPCGVLVLEPAPQHLTIYSIAVLPRHQRAGLGKALLSFGENRALDAGRSEIRLYTNPRMKRNVAFYQASGFAEIERRPHPSRPGEFLVDMAKTLDGTVRGQQ